MELQSKPEGFPFDDNVQRDFFYKWWNFEFDYRPYKDELFQISKTPNPYHTLRKADLYCIPLDFEFDSVQLRKEGDTLLANYPQLPGATGQEYPSHGWSRLFLRGNTTHKSVKLMEEDSHKPLAFDKNKAPYFAELLEKYASTDSLSFLSIINPHGCVALHEDVRYRGSLRGLHKIRVPVFYPEDCFMILEGFGTVPLNQGLSCIFDYTRPHGVYNFNKQNPKVDFSIAFDSNKCREWLDRCAQRSIEKLLDSL